MINENLNNGFNSSKRRSIFLLGMGAFSLSSANSRAAQLLIGVAQNSLRNSRPISSASVAVPPEVISAIKTANNKKLFNVSSSENYSENILKCDELIFSPKGVLNMLNWDARKAPFIAIVAKKWKFLAPQERALIQRPNNLIAGNGAEGRPGNTGQSGPYDDAAGSQGEQGHAGLAGETVQLPPIYLFGESIVDQPGNPIPWMNLVIIANGVLGGNGGRGGTGGNGGSGASGHPGSDSAFDCKRGPGDGGSGGPGGPGGPGGQAGAGGDGGTVYYVGTESFLEVITFANLVNVGGPAGLPGGGGRGGSGGSGGARGSNTFYCHGGRPGNSGRDGILGPEGAKAADGQKGLADVSTRSNLADLF